jgi:ligand-binding sensor domain-containing protein
MKGKKVVNGKFMVVLLLIAALVGHAQHFTNFTSADGLPSNNVNGVTVDAENHKWFGTQEGVAMYNDTVWTIYTKANGLIDNYINCISVDANSNIWVGTDVGISKFDGTSWTSFTTSDGLVNSMVNYIAGAPDGSVWIGTGGGASHFDGTTWKNYTLSDGLPGEMISYIAVGQTDVWLGTWIGGLSKFNGTTFSNYTMADSLPDNNITSIAIGANNTKWIGSYYGVGLFGSNDEWAATYRAKDGLFNNFIMDIDMDSKGNMWFGNYDIYTQDPGISKKSATGWRTFSVSNGLINAQIKRIAVDNTDHIWIATAAGVSKLTDANTGMNDFSAFPVKIYPNPATTEIHVDGQTTSGLLTISAVNGQQLLQKTLMKGSNTIPVDGLKAGIYLLRYNTETGVYTGKLFIR